MEIEAAKKSLEKQVILMEGVIGIGTVEEQSHAMIEVSIEKEVSGVKAKVLALLHDSTWEGHPVKITVVDQFKKH